MACCCNPPSRCPVCAYTCAIDSAAYGNIVGTSYYGRGEFQIEHTAQCPAFLGYPGSYRTQQLWRLPYLPAFNIPAPDIPEFQWNPGFPESLADCIAYWVKDAKSAAGYGGECCKWNGINFNCDDRTDAICDSKGNFKWRLMMIDCVQQSLIDITDEAVTKIGIFEGSWNGIEQSVLGDRDCQVVVFTALPEYFASPVVDCDV